MSDYNILVCVYATHQAHDYLAHLLHTCQTSRIQAKVNWDSNYLELGPYGTVRPRIYVEYCRPTWPNTDRLRGLEFKEVYFNQWLESEEDALLHGDLAPCFTEAQVHRNGELPETNELIMDLVPCWAAKTPAPFAREYSGRWAPVPPPSDRLHAELVEWRRQVAKHLADALINLPPMPERTEDTRLKGITIDRYQTKEEMAQAIQSACTPASGSEAIRAAWPLFEDEE